MASTITPARAPFGMVGETRLSHLTAKKNSQAALDNSSPFTLGKAPVQTTSSKRKASEILYRDDDAENVDPSAVSSKKTKFALGNGSGFTFSRPSTHFVLKSDNTTTSTPPAILSRPTATPRSRKNKSLVRSTPLSAPAGRTPPRKRTGLAKRTSAPFSRVLPPSSASTTTTPFSLDAALSGTVDTYAPTRAATKQYQADVTSLKSSSRSASWYFDIYEETPDEELGNLMEHSTQTLDISDDESKSAKQLEVEGPGKENVPPELSAGDMVAAAVSVPVSRRDMMEDGPRTPLGELEAKSFYAEGCDETSAFIVESEFVDVVDEKPVASASVPGPVPAAAVVASEERDESPSDHKSNQDAWQEILARVDEQQSESASAPSLPELAVEPASSVDAIAVPLPSSQDDAFAVEATSRDEAPLFDIWESESAKEEGEGEVETL